MKDAMITIKLSENEDVHLSLLTFKPITLSHTALGRRQPIIKSKINNAVTKLLCEEREDSGKKLEKLMKWMTKCTHL